MSLSAVVGSVLFEAEYKISLATPSQDGLLQSFVDAYAAHAILAVGSTVSITASGKSAMKAVLKTSQSDVLTMAKALVAYWGAETTPNSGFSSVSNDASGKVSAFEAAIEESITLAYSKGYPSYCFDFLEKTDAVVKGIIYTGITIGTGTPVPATVS